MSVFDNPSTPKQYLIRIDAWDPVGDATKTLYMGTRGFLTEPGDDPANVYFEPYVRSAIRRQVSLYRKRRIGGRSLPSVGVILLEQSAVTMGWVNYYFEGRDITVWIGNVGAAWDDHEVIFTGKCGTRTIGRDTITIPITDRKKEFEVAFPGTVFAGTGGAEGSSDQEDKNRPVGLGYVENATPVLVDRATSLYSLGTAVEDVVAVMDRGIVLTKVGGAPAGGQYSVDLVAGTITLGFAPTDPVRDITATFKGWKPAGEGYQESVATLIKALAKDHLGLVDGDLDLPSFTALETASDGRVGLYLSSGGDTAAIIDRLCDSIGAFWTITRDGKLRLGRLEAAAGAPVATYIDRNIIKDGIRQIRTDEPAFKWALKYAPNWTVQTDNDLAAGATYYAREFLSEDYRETIAEDTGVRDDFPGAAEEEIETLLVDKADAEAEAARLLALHSPRRDTWEVQVLAAGFQRTAGDEVAIDHPVVGAVPVNGRVIDMDDIARLNQSTQEIWV